jgi:hypothetical protein
MGALKLRPQAEAPYEPAHCPPAQGLGWADQGCLLLAPSHLRPVALQARLQTLPMGMEARCALGWVVQLHFHSRALGLSTHAGGVMGPLL